MCVFLKFVVSCLVVFRFCEKCGRNSQVEFRYIMTITANDHTGSSWLTMFNEAGQELLNGVTASRLKELENSDEFDAVLQVKLNAFNSL